MRYCKCVPVAFSSVSIYKTCSPRQNTFPSLLVGIKFVHTEHTIWKMTCKPGQIVYGILIDVFLCMTSSVSKVQCCKLSSRVGSLWSVIPPSQLQKIERAAFFKQETDYFMQRWSYRLGGFFCNTFLRPHTPSRCSAPGIRPCHRTWRIPDPCDCCTGDTWWRNLKLNRQSITIRLSKGPEGWPVFLPLPFLTAK